MTRPAAVCVAVCGLLLAAASSPPPAFERGLPVAQAGKVVVTLDRHVYEHARRDLGDVRVLDQQGLEAAYLLEQAHEEAETQPRRPRMLNRGFVRGRSATLTLDFGTPLLKSDLTLALSGENFRRRVSVEGRQRHEREWVTLTDGAYVFAVPEPAAARYETLSLPENNYQLLRVSVFNGSDETEPIEIRDAWVRPRGRRRPREATLLVRPQRSEDPERRETVLTLDLGARHQPFRGIALDVGDARFFRGVAVEARVESQAPPAPATPAPIVWVPLGEGTIYRYQDGAERHECLRLGVSGRERVLRLRVRNRDDRPLDVRELRVMTPIERLVFEAQAGKSYRLTYGAPALAAPSYDIARTVGDPAVWIAQASEAVPAQAVHVRQAGLLAPWTERHPRLVMAALVMLVIALGGVTWRALKAADRK